MSTNLNSNEGGVMCKASINRLHIIRLSSWGSRAPWSLFQLSLASRRATTPRTGCHPIEGHTEVMGSCTLVSPGPMGVASFIWIPIRAVGAQVRNRNTLAGVHAWHWQVNCKIYPCRLCRWPHMWCRPLETALHPWPRVSAWPTTQ